MEILRIVATMVAGMGGMLAAIAAYLLFRVSSDPHVIVYVKHDMDRPTLLMLIIENIGRGVAYDVRFSLSRSIPDFAAGITPTGKKKELADMNNGPLIVGIPQMAPGERRIINWGQYGGLRDALGNQPVRVDALFKGGWRIPWERKTESILEVASFENHDASHSPVLDQVKHLKRIAANIESLTRIGIPITKAPGAG